MRKETTIKVSREFKQFILNKKKQGEDFEATIIKLINNGIPQERTQSKKEIVKPQTDLVLQENQEGDKLMIFDDRLKVIIPRAEILLPIIENRGSQN